jgi:flagellar basal body rod protein FlgG
MIKSMFSAVTGLRSHQTMMDVIGNNIANVNTAALNQAELFLQMFIIRRLLLLPHLQHRRRNKSKADRLRLYCFIHRFNKYKKRIYANG